jgi:TetR/AcrR family transcriptional repressor of nem operon
VAEVMAAAGLTHGGFYAHFESKDDLIAEAITHMFDAAHNRFLSLTEGREPAAAIASYVDFYLSPSHRLERATGCPIATLSGDLPNLSGRVRERFTDGTERVVAGLAKLAKKLGAKDAEALAWSALAEMAGALALSRTVSDERAAAILRNSRAIVKARFGVGAR